MDAPRTHNCSTCPCVWISPLYATCRRPHRLRGPPKGTVSLNQTAKWWGIPNHTPDRMQEERAFESSRTFNSPSESTTVFFVFPTWWPIPWFPKLPIFPTVEVTMNASPVGPLVRYINTCVMEIDSLVRPGPSSGEPGLLRGHLHLTALKFSSRRDGFLSRGPIFLGRP